MSEGIDNILNGVDEEPQVEQPQVEAEPKEEAEEPVKAEQPRAPDGKFAPKGEKEDAPPASEYDGKATLAERRKRQEAEQRAADLEAKLQQFTNPPQAPPSLWDDEQGWQQHFGQQVTQSATQYATLNAKLETSEMLAAQAFDDFDDMHPKILEFMDANPAVRQEVLTDRHPWAKAYRMVKNNERAKELGATDVDSLRATIRAELEAELKAKEPVAIPQSLATAQSGRASASAPSAPPSIDDILRG